MNYQPKDFKKCLFNPLEDLENKYPALVEIFGLPVIRGQSGKILRYAMACYDPASPLIQDYPDWMPRKMAAASVAGFDLEEDERILEGIYTGENEEALEIIHTYLRCCIRSREWAMIVSNEEAFWEYNMRLKEPIAKSDKGDKDMVAAIAMKTKLAEDQEKFHERIKRYKKEFFGGDEDLLNATESNIGFSPEQIARKIKERV